MRFRILNLIALALLTATAIAQTETIEIPGLVSSRDGDTLTIDFEGERNPNIGDPVSISTEIAGRTLDGGNAEVIEVGDGFVRAKVIDGRPNVRMKAVIRSESSLPASPVDLYARGLELFKKALPAKADPFDWNTKADTQSPDYKSAFALLERAATQGHADAQYLCAIDERYRPKNADGSGRNAWLEKAADSGSAEAQFILSRAYYLGLYGENKDPDLSLDYLARAADQNHPEAIAELERRQLLTADLESTVAPRIESEAAPPPHGGPPPPASSGPDPTSPGSRSRPRSGSKPGPTPRPPLDSRRVPTSPW